ncbi:MAG: hypothetical protein ACLGIR_06395 [Actinomycetes bacterium]
MTKENIVRTIRSWALPIAVAAAAVPALALGEVPVGPPEQMADVARTVAARTATNDRTDFTYEWRVDENGAVLTNATVSPRGPVHITSSEVPSVSPVALLNRVAITVEEDPVACLVTARGRFASSRSVSSTVTEHLNEVVWRSQCGTVDESGAIEFDASDGPGCVPSDIRWGGVISDDGLWALGRGRSREEATALSGCAPEILGRVTLPVNVVENGNVHGTGSPLSFTSVATVVVDGVGGFELCVAGAGRQGVELVVEPAC